MQLQQSPGTEHISHRSAIKHTTPVCFAPRASSTPLLVSLATRSTQLTAMLQQKLQSSMQVGHQRPTVCRVHGVREQNRRLVIRTSVSSSWPYRCSELVIYILVITLMHVLH